MSTPSLAKSSRIWLHLAIIALLALCGPNVYAQVTVPDVAINEFMASNDDTIVDEDGDSSDWIELRNFTGSSIDIGGWYLTDDDQDLDKWQIPTGTSIDAGGFLLIFASGKDRSDAGSELHTNFKLGASGEYLALVESDGNTIMHEYSPDYPAQFEDISYGLGTEGSEQTLLSSDAACYARVPEETTYSPFSDWLNDTSTSGWESGIFGVAYDDAETYDEYTGLDVTSIMDGINQTILIKSNFTVADPLVITGLTLRMRYDDGFIAYINGTEVCRSSTAGYAPSWNVGASAGNTDSNAVQWEDYIIDLAEANLVAGSNVLAIHGLNRGTTSSDFLIQPWLVATVDTGVGVDYRYFETPTPGSANASGKLGFVAPVEADMPHGYYDDPITVSLYCDTEDAEIRYTTDCSTPNAASALYDPASPIQVAGSTIIRAKAFKLGYDDSQCTSFSYLYTADVLTQSEASAYARGFPEIWHAGAGGSGIYDSEYRDADYAMDPDVIYGEFADEMVDALKAIPVLSVVTDMDNMFDPYTGIFTNSIQRASTNPLWEKPASLELFNADDDFTVNAGVRISGEAARWVALNDKQSFRFVFRGEYGATKLRTDFFNDPSGVDEYDTILMRAHWGHSFVCSLENSLETGASWTDINPATATYIRDIYGHDIYGDVTGLSSRGRFAHMFMNGIYWGLFEVVERPDNSFNAEHRGGSKDDYDVLKGALGYTNVNGLLQDGQRDAYNKLFTWFDASSSGSNYTSVTPTTDAVLAQVEQYLDVDAYIDYMISLWYIARLDFPRKNWYVAGRRDPDDPDGPPLERFRFYTWDSEASLWEPDWSSQASRWMDTDTSNDTGPVRIFRRIRHNEQFQRRWADRVQELCFNGGVLDDEIDANLERFEDRYNEIQQAILCESARWGDNPPERVDNPTTRNDWETECTRLMNDYFPNRTGYMLAQMTDAGLWPGFFAPEYNQHGGAVDETFMLEMTNPNADGSIYYTLDGSDPRDGGATLYSGPISLDGLGFVVVNSCVKIDSDYSAMNHASFITFGEGGLVISEIMYNPPEGTSLEGSYNSEDYEFIEIWNNTSGTIDLEGMQISGDVEYTFGDFSIAANQRLLVVSSANAMMLRYGMGVASQHEFDGVLGNGDGEVSLLGSDGTPIFFVEYEDGGAWPGRADGTGSSLELKDPLLDFTDADSWRNSAEYLGSPGWAGAGALGDIIVNEVLTHTDLPDVDFIELYNTTDSSINITGWYLSDSASNLMKYQIPSTTIPANGYVVFDENDFNVGETGFALSSAHGDDVWLTEADGTGRIIRFVDHVEFGAALNGESLGCWPDADGGRLCPMVEPTPGDPNEGPRFGPVIISEVAYNVGDDSDYEFIEILNTSDDDVDLTGWAIDGGIDYEFPDGATLEEGEVAVVIVFNPDNPINASRVAAFRSYYGIDSSVMLYGGYGGLLDNGGERVVLYRPDDPPLEEPYYIPLVEEDTVEYDNVDPWPLSADGLGDSLNRAVPAAWGDDAASWMAAEPTPGIADVLLPGDVNLDNKVDISDFLILKGNYGTPSGAEWEDGDFNGDGAVDIADFLILKGNYGVDLN